MPKIKHYCVHFEKKIKTLIYFKISQSKSFSRNSSDLHFSLGLVLSLVCETGGQCFKLLIQWEKNVFDPLLILYVCPLTKKWSVYNCNGRFIFNSERQNNNKKNPEKCISNSYKLICILMSQISIWPLRKTWLSTWWQNPCWQSQRSDISCSWPSCLAMVF